MRERVIVWLVRLHLRPMFTKRELEHNASVLRKFQTQTNQKEALQ